MLKLKTIKSQKGFSLLEIMVAILILGSTFIGLIHTFPYAMSIIKSSENETKAAYLAQEKMEEFYQSRSGDINVGVVETKQRLGGSGSYLYYFQRQSEIYYVDSDLENSSEIPTDDIGIKKITVSVYYTSSLSKSEKTYTLNSIIIEN